MHEHPPWAQSVGAAPTLDEGEFSDSTPEPTTPLAGVIEERHAAGLRVTDRDRRIVELVWKLRVATKRQIQIAEFGLEHDSRCELRLTKLTGEHYLDTYVPSDKRPVNQPAIYTLTRRCTNGMYLLKDKYDDDTITKYLTRVYSVDHQLAISDMYVLIKRACDELGFILQFWQRHEDLDPLLTSYKVIPDAYFRISKNIKGTPEESSYFLELELLPKSSQVIKRKLLEYAKIIYTRAYQDIFGTAVTPRVLFVFVPYLGNPPTKRIATSVSIARDLGVRCSRFTGLDKLKHGVPIDTLTAAVWHSPTGQLLPLLTGIDAP